MPSPVKDHAKDQAKDTAAAEAPARHRLLNRERSILAFNRRVLAQAAREDVPLLERLRYICIVSSNMDEFFEVRFADALEAASEPGSGTTHSELAKAAEEAHTLVDEQYALFNDVLMPALAREGIVLINHAERNEAQRAWVAQYFHREVQPLLVPLGLDPSHPFPQVANKSLNFIVQLGGLDAYGRENGIAIVKVPRVLPRIIRMPDRISEGKQAFVQLTSVIRAHLAELFPSRTVESFSQFRVTRDSDLDVDEDEVKNLRTALRSELSARHFGEAIRLEVVQSCPAALSDFLLTQFDLPEAALYRVNGPVNLVRLNSLIDQARASSHRFKPHEPSWPATLPRNRPIMASVAERDVLLHHPFESFEPVVQFLREAVEDPNVLAIKQTIYRTGSESVLMELLLEAARRGKEVLAVVELKARFDEEANINWAERLEAVGAQVVYGIVGLKTHAKLLLVTRKQGPRMVRYAHLSTGNYNPKTARLYTDLGCLTADPEMTTDVEAVFQHLASLNPMAPTRRLLVAPESLQAQMVALLDKVGEAARKGKDARVVAKFNALTDPVLIEALVRASQCGAQIDLIVRGACMLAPGVPGLTETVRVRSLVGRFLEHSRVFYFRWGDGLTQEALYLGSADWMSRNMERRIEVAWPVRDPALRQRVIDETLVPYLHDDVDAWTLASDGSYARVADGKGQQSAQRALVQRHR
ncbi:polyphosphate kinase 1 [Leptothrix discophora]|uniref:Polyphosphate kinase n=1 Tax=Leptothrix discophora TaxID=89 RepID=A0ABT9G6P9_LEPDI|nr:polyphosphate kinase 1 [Leptothrix discophora]MDP4302085.1 polyphosphate kinase 1 [Leptothrix discophora]